MMPRAMHVSSMVSVFIPGTVMFSNITIWKILKNNCSVPLPSSKNKKLVAYW